MSFKDLFKKKEKEEKPVNINTLLGVRALAVGYCLYCLWQIIKMYMEGGEQAPSIWLLLAAILVLGGGSVWIAVMTVQYVLKKKREDQERLDEEDARLAAEAEAAEAEAAEAEEAEDALEEETEEEAL